jgi:hypothetical protein
VWINVQLSCIFHREGSLSGLGNFSCKIEKYNLVPNTFSLCHPNGE